MHADEFTSHCNARIVNRKFLSIEQFIDDYIPNETNFFSLLVNNNKKIKREKERK